MIYIHIESAQLKILALKKSLLGQYEITTFEKKHDADLLDNGRVVNIDVLASAIKEGVTHANALSDKDVVLVLPQESFSFLKVEVPVDIASSAIASFVYDKARSTLQMDLDNSYSNYFIKESAAQKQVSFYALESSVLDSFTEALTLLNLKVVHVVPETLAIFKLFEKTLRQEKKENIWYVSYSGSDLNGYLFDSGGPLADPHWKAKLEEGKKIEEILKAQTDGFAERGNKLNRIILSGNASDSIRQDTFTKAVGAWTNPLKRIIPNFYDAYLKSLVIPTGTAFPILTFDVCFGAFIFLQENKDFQLLKRAPKAISKRSSFSMPRIPLFRKELFIFLAAFGLSFGAFILLSRSNFTSMKLPSITVPSVSIPNIPNPFVVAKPSPTTIPTTAPTPTPSYDKETIRIKILNGAGTPGIASTAKSLLSDGGFKEIVTANADNYDYTTTVYQIKAEYNDVKSELTKALDGSVKTPKVEKLSDKDTSDIIVILGSDFK